MESDTLIAILVAGVTHGTLALSTNGGFTYIPAINFNGSDSFTYKANDGAADSNVATVNINVHFVNIAPVAIGDAVATNEDTPVSGNVLTNDSDADGDALSGELGAACHGQRSTMKTGVPTLTCRNSHSASGIRIRMQPCEAE